MADQQGVETEKKKEKNGRKGNMLQSMIMAGQPGGATYPPQK